MAAWSATAVLVAMTAVPGFGSPARSGSFSVLTYNVAGLPEFLSSGNPAANTAEIGRRVRGYDIVNVQEDFNYHADLYAANTHPYRTPTSGGAGVGSGLNTMSNFPFEDLDRLKWANCNGTDCLTPKGWTIKRVRIAEGVFVDVYNLHANAGTTEADLSARRANITQISNSIATVSAGNAVIVMGDTNTRYTRVGDNIRDLVNNNGLKDAWVERVRGGQTPALGSPALTCDDANVTNSCEVVDKIFYRGNRFINLSLTNYSNENALFRTADNQMLSDHYPIAAWFSWSLTNGISMSDRLGGPHGSAFTDVDRVVLGGNVRSVQIRTGQRVDNIGVTLSNGTVLNHGGTGGTARSLTLNSGEYVSQMRVSQAKEGGRTRIFSVHIMTNHGRSLSGGTPKPDERTFVAPPGWQITGFHGRSGAEVDKVGVIYTTTTATAPQFVELVARHSNKVADVHGGSIADGATVVQWTSNGGQNQQWQFRDTGNGYVQIINRRTGKCLDVSGASTADGAKIIQWTCGSGANQQWSVTTLTGGFVRLVARHSGKCLEVPSAQTADNVQLTQWTCGSGANQQWTRRPVS